MVWGDRLLGKVKVSENFYTRGTVHLPCKDNDPNER